MEIWTILLDVVVLLGAGALLGGLFERIGQSAIVGYLLAGALLGPNVFHLVRTGQEVIAISELGVALLLFAIGLEFSWKRLIGLGRVALGGGVVQVVGTIAVASSIALLAGFGTATALTIGAICALSSTACVLRVLTARSELESPQGAHSLGILLVQDMAVVPLVLVVGVLAAGGTASEVLGGLARTSAIGLGLIAALFVVFHVVVPRILGAGSVRSNRELPLLIAVVSGLGAGVVAHTAGVSPALGAFVAGMLLGSSPFAVQVQADVHSLKTLLLTLFFTSIGLLTDPAWIAANALLVAAAVLVVVLGKFLLAWASLRVFNARADAALATGLCLAQIGEFSFVLAGVARGTLLSETAFLLVVSTTLITMVLTPYLVGYAPRFAAKLSRSSVLTAEPVDDDDPGDLVIVVGFGPAGRAACREIAEAERRVIVIDQNPAAARDARLLGYGAITGDATQSEVLEHAGLDRASFVVVTVPQATTALHLVDYVRQHAPSALILVRARFHRSMSDLADAGAHVVVDEEREVGRLIAEAHRHLGRPDQQGA